MKDSELYIVDNRPADLPESNGLSDTELVAIFERIEEEAKPDMELYAADDRCIMPEVIEKMSKEELQRAIRHLEEKHRREKEQKQKLAAIS